MKKLLNTSRVTVMPMRPTVVSATVPVLLSPAVVAREAVEARLAAIQGDAQVATVLRRQPETYRPGLLILLVGHVVASLLGLAIGYYIMCCLRPAEFNWWHLPVPHSLSGLFNADVHMNSI